MNRVNASPLIKRGLVRQKTYTINSSNKLIDENEEINSRDNLDIDEAWVKLSKPQDQKTSSDINKMLECFGQLKYFKEIIQEGGADSVKVALSQSNAVQTFQDEILFRQGTQADDMYILLEGKVNIYYITYMGNLHSAEHETQENLQKKNMLVRTVKVGDTIGNLNLFYSKQYKNMAICAEPCKFIQISKSTYQKSLKYADKISAEQTFEFLRSVSIFSHWTDDQLIEILLQGVSEKVNFNSVIFNQNQKSTDFYIVKSGQYGAYQKKTEEWKTNIKQAMQLLRADDNQNHKFDQIETYQDDFSKQFNLIYVHEYGPLDHFGHQDIIENKRRNSFVVCKSKEGGELIKIKSSVFIQIILANPQTTNLLLKKQLEDKQLFKPERKLRNFIIGQKKVDLDAYKKQMKKYSVFQDNEIQSQPRISIAESPYFTGNQSSVKINDKIFKSHKASFASTEETSDSPISMGTTPFLRSNIKSKTSLPKLALPEKFLSTNSLTQTQFKYQLKRSFLTLNNSNNNSIPSLINIECQQSPQSMTQSSLLKKIQSYASSSSIKLDQQDTNIFYSTLTLQKTQSLVQKKRQDIF